MLKCEPQSRSFWLAWLIGSLAFSVSLIKAFSNLSTVRARKYVNMVALLLMHGMCILVVYLQPDAVNPVFPPADE
eukprot:scaffold448612_cov46-Prasinocladus_malaysianus.AAC.1